MGFAGLVAPRDSPRRSRLVLAFNKRSDAIAPIGTLGCWALRICPTSATEARRWHF
jgi:hypothetical protein